MKGIKIKKQKVNEQIRATEVRLIDKDGNNIGVKPTKEALSLARQQGLDLLEVSGQAIPPVCRIIDYKKYIYEQKSKLRKNKAQKTGLKEFKIRPNIGEQDLNSRIERGRKFIQDGYALKFTVKFRGRERFHPKRGELKLKIVESELSDVARVEKSPRMRGNFMSMTLVTAGSGKGKQNEQTKNAQSGS